ncbi:MAG: MFS transporter [Clostridia bacterium]|nr:MFS transporter [Clostridia bacterium]
MGGIGGGLVFPILPLVGVQLGLSGAFVGFVLASNRLTRLFANPVTGHLVDRVGGRLPLAVGLLVESLATLSMEAGLHLGHPGLWFLLGRALWGVGSSLLIVGGTAAALAAARPEERGRTAGGVRSATSLGMPAGLVLGGVVAGLWSNDAAFLLATGLAAAGALLALGALPATTPSRRASPPPAGRAEERRDGHGTLGAFLELARDRRVLALWVYNFLTFFTLQGALLTTLVLLVDARGFSLLGLPIQPTASLLMAVVILASAGTSLATGRLVDRTGRRAALLPAAAAAIALGFAVLGEARTTAAAIVGALLLGVGMGGTNVPLLALLGDLAPRGRRGRAVGLFQVVGDAGGTLGPIVGNDASLRFGYAATYLGLAALVALALPLAAVLARAERPGPPSRAVP